jgi:hypothetical protein
LREIGGISVIAREAPQEGIDAFVAPFDEPGGSDAIALSRGFSQLGCGRIVHCLLPV